MYFVRIRNNHSNRSVMTVITDADNLPDFLCLLEFADSIHSYTVTGITGLLEPNSFGSLGSMQKWKLLLFEPEPVKVVAPWRTPEEIKAMSEAFYDMFPDAPGNHDALVNANASIDSIPE